MERCKQMKYRSLYSMRIGGGGGGQFHSELFLSLHGADIFEHVHFNRSFNCPQTKFAAVIWLGSVGLLMRHLGLNESFFPRDILSST